jgi:hypothetical protein
MSVNQRKPGGMNSPNGTRCACRSGRTGPAAIRPRCSRTCRGLSSSGMPSSQVLPLRRRSAAGHPGSRGQLVREDRDRGLRRGDQVGRRGRDHVAGSAPGCWSGGGSNFSSCGIFPCSRRTVIGLPAGWVHSTVRRPSRPASSAANRPSAGSAALGQHHQAAGAHGHQHADAVHAEQRREAGQRRAVVRVAGSGPGEAGEDPAAHPFRHAPQDGQHQQQEGG